MAHNGTLVHGALQLFLHRAARAGGFPHTPGPSAEGCSQVSSGLLTRGDGAAALVVGLSSLLCPGFSLVYAG